MIKCLECGEEFKRISNSHLLKCCKLTMKEYSIKHCIPIESLAEPLTPRNPMTLEEKQERQSKLEITYRKNQIQQLTYDETQVIIGSLLGDAYIFQGKKLPNSSYLILEQGIKQLNYLWWKGTKLKRLDAKFYQYYQYNSVKKRYTTVNQVRTSSSYLIGDIAKYFYNNESKSLNPEIFDYLDAPGLAIWFMDDGMKYGDKSGALSTQSFSQSDNILIQNFLKIKFNIDSKILQDTNNQPYIVFPVDEFKKFKAIIEPYMFYQMLYKIDNKPKPECILSKRIIFDSCHYLDEYLGKCSNLHGGRYELWVSVKGEINPDTGMVLDYGYMKTIIDKYIKNEFDHHCLNYVHNSIGWRSTTELLCAYIWKVLIEFFPNLYELELHETEGSKCIYKGPSLDEMKFDKTLDILNSFTETDIKWRQRIISEFSEVFENIDEEFSDIEIIENINGEETLVKLSDFLYRHPKLV